MALEWSTHLSSSLCSKHALTCFFLDSSASLSIDLACSSSAVMDSTCALRSSEWVTASLRRALVSAKSDVSSRSFARSEAIVSDDVTAAPCSSRSFSRSEAIVSEEVMASSAMA